MKIKSIILSFVLATTMTGCAELNNTLHVLAQQGEIYRNGTSSNSLFRSLYLVDNKEYCQQYHFCQVEGKGFENFAYRAEGDVIEGTVGNYTSFHIGNNVAKLEWQRQKCYEETPRTHLCDRKYGDKIDAIFKKSGGKNQYHGKVITTDL
nr:MAG TPA: hypothetical protein [Caudoviricetes sp.]